MNGPSAQVRSCAGAQVLKGRVRKCPGVEWCGVRQWREPGSRHLGTSEHWHVRTWLLSTHAPAHVRTCARGHLAQPLEYEYGQVVAETRAACVSFDGAQDVVPQI